MGNMDRSAVSPELSGGRDERNDVQVYGNCPVQGVGRVMGYPLYFRARWAHWTFTICTSHQELDRAVDAEPRVEENGFFRCGQVEGFFMTGDYGSQYEAGAMSLATATGIIEDCIRQFKLGFTGGEAPT